MTVAVIKALRKMIIARKICNFGIYPYLSKYLVICWSDSRTLRVLANAHWPYVAPFLWFVQSYFPGRSNFYKKYSSQTRKHRSDSDSVSTAWVQDERHPAIVRLSLIIEKRHNMPTIMQLLLSRLRLKHYQSHWLSSLSGPQQRMVSW